MYSYAYALLMLKFGLSEKHTKFEKIFLMVLTNQLIYLVNVKTMRKIFSNYVCFSKSPNFIDFFAKIKPLLTHVGKTPPLSLLLLLNLVYLADSSNMQQQSSIHKYDSTMMTIKDHVHCQARHPWNVTVISFFDDFIREIASFRHSKLFFLDF